MSKKMVKRSLVKKIMLSVFVGAVLFSTGVASANSQIQEGTNASAWVNSVAIGDYSNADAWSSVALGLGSQTSKQNVVSVGYGGTSGQYTNLVGDLWVPNTRSIINITDILVENNLQRLAQNSNATLATSIAGMTNEERVALGSYAVNFNTLQQAVSEEAQYREQNVRELSNWIQYESVLAEERHEAFLEVATDHDTRITAEVAAREAEDNTIKAALIDTTTDLDRRIIEEAQYREQNVQDLSNWIQAEANKTNQSISGLNQRLDRTNAKINKVGAGAAALAALHPLEYDPDDKLTFSAGMGNYAGENAAALGAFYRPNEKFMVSLGGTMGNGENMVNLGLSIGLDKPNGLAKLSKRELIQKVNSVEAENDALEDRVAKLEALVASLVANK